MDISVLEELINRQYANLYQWALTILKQPFDAEDAVQNACMRAWLHHSEVINESRCCSWLNSIVYRECLTILRNRRRVNTVALDVVSSTARTHEASPDLLVDYWQLIEDVAAMPDICQQAFMLRYDIGYPIQTIAELLNIPRSTVSSRLHRARKTLRRQLDVSDTRLGSRVS